MLCHCLCHCHDIDIVECYYLLFAVDSIWWREQKANRQGGPQLNKHSLASRALNHTICPISTSEQVSLNLMIFDHNFRNPNDIFPALGFGNKSEQCRYPDKCLQLCIINPALCRGITALLNLNHHFHLHHRFHPAFYNTCALFGENGCRQ